MGDFLSLDNNKNWTFFLNCKFNQKNAKMKFCHLTKTKIGIFFTLNSTTKIHKQIFFHWTTTKFGIFFKTVNSTKNNDKMKICHLTTTKFGIF